MKIFTDAVHGRIPVPVEYCKYIIDTFQFQRLRRIEQTSVRDLYPCAHHDRFIHSLGTYNVGHLMAEEIVKNCRDRKEYSFLDEIKLLNQDPESSFWEAVQKNYEVACLLHDCGHAPFSHTFEEYFSKVSTYEDDMRNVVVDYILDLLGVDDRQIRNIARDFISQYDKKASDIAATKKKIKGCTIELNQATQPERIAALRVEVEQHEKILDNAQIDFTKARETVFNNSELTNQIEKKQLLRLMLEYFYDIHYASPNFHERVSAWLVLHKDGFGKVLKEKLNVDPLLITRMITGCQYQDNDNHTSSHNPEEIQVKQVLNCFISLLNGHHIDADRLDYCLRDVWASGINATNINIKKLIFALSIEQKEDEKFVVCFDKQALSEIEGVLDVKNKFHFWCLNHHKVLHRKDLLDTSMQKLAIAIAPEDDRKRYHDLQKYRTYIYKHQDSTNANDDIKATEQNLVDKQKDRINWDVVDLHNKGIQLPSGLKENIGAWIDDGLLTELEDGKIISKQETKMTTSLQKTILDEIHIDRGAIEMKYIGEIFNYHSFIKPKPLTNSDKIYLVADDDVIHLLKRHLLCNENESKDDFFEKSKEYVKDFFHENRD